MLEGDQDSMQAAPYASTVTLHQGTAWCRAFQCKPFLVDRNPVGKMEGTLVPSIAGVFGDFKTSIRATQEIEKASDIERTPYIKSTPSTPTSSRSSAAPTRQHASPGAGSAQAERWATSAAFLSCLMLPLRVWDPA